MFILEETSASGVTGAVNVSLDIKQLSTKVKERRGQTPTGALALESKNTLIHENCLRNRKNTKQRLVLTHYETNIWVVARLSNSEFYYVEK